MNIKDRWIAAFEAMDDRAQLDYLLVAEAAAKDHPRRQATQTGRGGLALVSNRVGSLAPVAVPAAQQFGHADHVVLHPLVSVVK